MATQTVQSIGERVFDVIEFVIVAGLLIGSAYLAFVAGTMVGLTTGVFVGTGITLLTNGVVLALRQDASATGLEQFSEGDVGYVMLAMVLQIGTLLVAGAYALLSGSALATGVAGVMIGLYMIGLVTTALKRLTGVEEPPEDTSEEQSESEWDFELDDLDEAD